MTRLACCRLEEEFSGEKKKSLPRAGPSPPFYMPREGTEHSIERESLLLFRSSWAPPVITVLPLCEWAHLVARSAERKTWGCPCCGVARPYPMIYAIIGHDGVHDTTHCVRACLIICRPTPLVSLHAARVVVGPSFSWAHSLCLVDGQAKQSLLHWLGEA